MLNKVGSILFLSVVVGASMLGASGARAELDACGGIFLSADAACEYRPKEQCMTQCMTVAVEQSCVAEIYSSCETSCTSTASVDCESSCTQSCVNGCTTTSTTSMAPTCMDLCLSDCDDGGAGNCGASGHKGPCGRCAKHNCDRKCEAKCGDAPEAMKVTTVTECMPTCTNACSASCTAKANTQCQVDCQEGTYVQCEQKMVEKCQTQCKQTGGAIFCDGQFLNASNVNSCADELRAKVEINIDIKASITTAGSATTSTVNQAGRKVNSVCAVASVGAGRADSALGALFPLAALTLWRMRRRVRRGTRDAVRNYTF